MREGERGREREREIARKEGRERDSGGKGSFLLPIALTKERERESNQQDLCPFAVPNTNEGVQSVQVP